MQAAALSARLGVDITIEYLPPASADVHEQNEILERAARTRPTGIAVDPVDAIGNIAAINRLREQGTPLVVFDSPAPDAGITPDNVDRYLAAAD